ncbi:FAD-dependent monooxygenase [Nocardioides daphniae]|uniref:Monooxygenase n=1 Tax=Nocardioides daphniae TaxID=402297 RepID=A0A4P7UDH1_9ACTN|nr:FAD-dependent monooxygenase [Nocardioides daphniae]QCC77591.1 FAD-binding monooxygenase [Nocardioides daphniae]GGD30444.1 monooxygenase [Nocardioides daphniae]
MPTITILGGGVAGLALAATLDPAMYDVRVIERNPHGGKVPTAFGIWPFALDALDRIGLADPLRTRGWRLTTGVVTADVARRPVAVVKRDASTWLVTRPGLLQLLEQAVPDAVVRECRHVDDVASLEGDLVVAADGARSVVRRQVWGEEPRDSGVVAVRGVLPEPPEGPLDRMQEFWGDGMLFGIGPNLMADGLGTNWYASARRPEGSPGELLAWARSAYAQWPEAVRATLAAATEERTVVNSILESRRPRRLVEGRYVLVGDAAHAMTPNLGRGACEALVDAVVLGEALNARGLAGVEHYAAERRAPGQRTRVAAGLAMHLALSRRVGPAALRVVAALSKGGEASTEHRVAPVEERHDTP